MPERCPVPECGGSLVAHEITVGHVHLHCGSCRDRVTQVQLLRSTMLGTFERIEALVRDVQARQDLVAQVAALRKELASLSAQHRLLKQSSASEPRTTRAFPVVRPRLDAHVVREQVLVLLPEQADQAVTLAHLADETGMKPYWLAKYVMEPLLKTKSVARRPVSGRRGRMYLYYLAECAA